MSDTDAEVQARLDGLAPIAVVKLTQIFADPNGKTRDRLTALWALLRFASRDAPGNAEARTLLGWHVKSNELRKAPASD